MSSFSLKILPSLKILFGFSGTPSSLLLNTTPLFSRSIEIFVPFGRKIMYLVLLTLTAKRLVLNQFATFCSSHSQLTLLIRAVRSESDSIMAVLSAKSKVNSSVDKLRSLIKQRKRIGPSILPCKTEMSIHCLVDLWPSISVNCLLSDK